MALTGYEKPLDQYTQKELVEIAKKYTIYYTTASGQGSISGYQRLNKTQLISLIKNDSNYIEANPKAPRRIDGKIRTNRFKDFKFNSINADKLMNEILSRLGGTERSYPSEGRYYTFIYYAKTPGILYDRHPLIRAGGMLPKGFLGFNYHLGKIRQYNTEDGDRLVSGLYELSQKEFETLQHVPYGKLIQN
jgi:hypothetical protein